jgi:perosamine synthetase
MGKIKKICNKYNLYLIEDCAEAIGSKINGIQIGTYSDASIFSFFGNKTITTGEGGMVCFKSKKIYERAKILRDHGMSKSKRYWHEHIGNNYRLTNLQAAVGCAQLKKLNTIVKKKIKIAKNYNKYFKKSKNIKFIDVKTNITNSYWLYPFYLRNIKNFKDRDLFLNKLLEKGIEGRNFFYPLSMMPIYKKFVKKDKFPVAKYVSERGICLPTSYSLNLDDIKRISKTILELT